MQLTWLGHASFKIKSGELAIYIDPVGEPELFTEKADIILISHHHYDHWSREIVNRIANDNTLIFGPPEVARELFGTKVLRPGESVTHENISITAVAAFQTRTRNIMQHPEGAGIGFLIAANDKTVFYAGDTDTLPAHAELPKLDVLLVPVGGTYVLTPKEAAALTAQLQPKTAIPMHWGKTVGHLDDAELFRELVAGRMNTDVQILAIGGEISI